MTTIVSQLGIAGLQTRFNAVLGRYVNIAREFPPVDVAVDALYAARTADATGIISVASWIVGYSATNRI